MRRAGQEGLQAFAPERSTTMADLGQPMLSVGFARRFADSWFAAWNAHDLDAMMAHYAQGIQHSSPFIARYNNDPECAALQGIAAVRDYFGRALERNPTLRFDPVHVALGVDTVSLVYRRMTGEVASETFFFDADGKVVRSISHYGI